MSMIPYATIDMEWSEDAPEGVKAILSMKVLVPESLVEEDFDEENEEAWDEYIFDAIESMIGHRPFYCSWELID